MKNKIGSIIALVALMFALASSIYKLDQGKIDNPNIVYTVISKNTAVERGDSRYYLKVTDGKTERFERVRMERYESVQASDKIFLPYMDGSERFLWTLAAIIFGFIAAIYLLVVIPRD